jgi:aminoglycoside phosphotransferase (APT) family kinase protein
VPQWSAEFVVDEDLARSLVGEQFPELPLESVVELSRGWDNTVWLVDAAWAFRFPRREIAVQLVERELAVLPRIAPLLPVPIPTPVLVGRPTGSFPWPFTGCRYLPGTELGSAALTGDGELAVARAAGTFLRTLHGSEVYAAVSDLDLPADPNRRSDMSHRVPLARKHLEEAERAGLWSRPRRVEHVLEAASELPAVAPSALLHGDFHFRHVLVGERELAGVIDWGDVCVGDPSIDLLLLWSFSDPARAAFLGAYGHVTDEQLLRARVVALSISAVLASYGRDESLPEIERAALASLERAAA